MWGTFEKPLKRAIWNTLGLHAVLTTCLRSLSVLDSTVLPAASFCQQAGTMSAYKFTQRAVASPDAPQKPRRLQDWEKLKKYVPSHKHGDVCPNGVPALAERGNDDNESDSE